MPNFKNAEEELNYLNGIAAPEAPPEPSVWSSPSKLVTAPLRLYGGLWDKTAELAKEYLSEKWAAPIAAHIQTPGLVAKELSGTATPEDIAKYIETAKRGYGEYADIPTKLLRGMSARYLPAVETPQDAGVGREILGGAAELAGMALPMGRIGWGLAKAGVTPLATRAAGAVAPKVLKPFAEAAAREAAPFAAYEALAKPAEGETRFKNALHGLAVGGAFGAGGKLVEGALAKAYKPFGQALEKNAILTEPSTVNYIKTVGEKMKSGAATPEEMVNWQMIQNQALTKGEEGLLNLAGTIRAGALGATPGFMQPADTIEECLRNAAIGAGTFAAAHTINPSAWSWLLPKSEIKGKKPVSAVQSEPSLYDYKDVNVVPPTPYPANQGTGMYDWRTGTFSNYQPTTGATATLYTPRQIGWDYKNPELNVPLQGQIPFSGETPKQIAWDQRGEPKGSPIDFTMTGQPYWGEADKRIPFDNRLLIPYEEEQGTPPEGSALNYLQKQQKQIPFNPMITPYAPEAASVKPHPITETAAPDAATIRNTQQIVQPQPSPITPKEMKGLAELGYTNDQIPLIGQDKAEDLIRRQVAPPTPEKIERGLKDLGYSDAERSAMSEGQRYHAYDNAILQYSGPNCQDKKLPCQAKVEMSYSYQSRNVPLG